MDRVIVYIDGFNVYKGLEAHIQKNPGKLPHNKVNYHTLSKKLISDSETLTAVRWYSAVPPADRHDPSQREMILRHESYRKLLEQSGVDIRISGYKKEKRKCPHCSRSVKRNIEKETDERCSLEMLEDVVFNRVDTVLLMSSDSDFIPAVYSLSRYSGRRRQIKFAVCPPLGREGPAKALLSKSHELFQTRSRWIRGPMIRDSLFDGKLLVTDRNFKHKRPD